jgi:DNA (cytosine-5)-methyltransferase 1
MGYHRAGFDVIGIDINPQPNYPFKFRDWDALAYLEMVMDGRGMYGRAFSAVHASPPCQDHSSLRHTTGKTHGTGHLLAATRELLDQSGLPWVIENVPGAPMRTDYRLCGCQFGLGVRRERWFETSWRGFDLRPPCSHTEHAITVAGHGSQGWEYKLGRQATQADRQRAMGIDWMNQAELAQAIPPAFTQYVGEQLLQALERAA